jgi:hypothetical protein
MKFAISGGVTHVGEEQHKHTEPEKD